MISRQRQRGYLLITVVVTLFLLATVSVMLSHDSAISANTASADLEAAQVEYVARAGMQHALWQADNNACRGDMDVPDTALGADTYSATVTGASAGTAYTLNADQDAWVRSDDPSINNGTSVSNHIRFEGGNTEYSLTRFDVSGLKANTQILSATAWFNLKVTKEHAEGPISIHEITADWAEESVTWDSFADAYHSASVGMIPSQDTGGVWVSINLTGLVQAWVNGQPNFGILMKSSAEGVHGEYMAREDGTNPPRLEVVVGSGSASPVTIRTTGKLDNGITRKLKDKLAKTYQPSNTVTMQLGADSGADVLIDSFYERNYGGANYLQINDESSWQQRPLLRFGLATVPYGARIVSATLELHNSSTNAAGTATVHRLTRSFVEGTRAGGGTADGATWATYDGSDGWSSAGGDFDPTPVAEANVDASSGWVSWDITPLVDAWLNGAANDGLLIRSTDGLKQAKFASREDADPTLRPKLTITYACECGSPCMSQTGSGNILLVVAEKTWLTDYDQALKSRFEAWGYTVTLISDSDNQTYFNGLIATNDVVFVSESVDTTRVGTKLNAAPIGVVNTDGWLNDELGFESGDSSNWPVGTSIDVTDTTHYITAPFAEGALDLYEAAMGGLAIGNTKSPDLVSLADWPGGTALATLEAGAMTAAGATAAGRRVMLPLGRESSSNLDYLTHSGWLLVQRSIDWAMGVAIAPAGKNVLLVVADAVNLAAQDAAKQTLIEGWGHTVNLIDDDAVQTEFDAAYAVNDVVYVSEEIVTGALDTKLRNAYIGVVFEEQKIPDELGVSSGESVYFETSIDITDNTHYVTETFSTGALTIVSSSQEVGALGGTLAPDLQILAQRPSSTTPTLAVIAKGGTLFDGGTAEGRRAKVPWGGNTFDINALTADGQTIMKRAIEWGAGTGCGSTTSLWMLVADANNPTAEENTRQTLLESWCYAVTMGTASEPQEVYDKYAAEFDVVYVPASVNYTDVGTKLKFQPIGVVAEPSILSSRLGFTSGTSGYTGTVTELTDNSHYITSGFPLGNLALTTTSTSLRHFTNTMGPGFKTLSVRPTQTDPMIMTLDTGDELLWGGNAPDRRVMLPWGGSSTFDVSNLTDDGLTILQRSLEWVAAEKLIVPIAHWKMDEMSGTIASDSAGGHDAALINGTSWGGGQLNGATLFDGSNDFLDVPHDDALSLTQEMSFSAWINASSFGTSYQTIVAKDDGGAGSNYWFGTWRDDLAFGFFSNGFFREVATTGLGIQTNVWNHVAATFDDSLSTVVLYLNGTEVANGVLNFSPTAVTADLTLGKSPDGEYWRGLLDDVRIYDRVLDGPDIAALAVTSEGGTGGPAEYLDNFDTAVYAGSDGTREWSGDPWEELTESDGPGAGKLYVADDPVVAEPGSKRLVIDSRSTQLKRPVDLSGFSNAYLSFNYRRDGYPTPNDYFMVLVSTDGSNWTELERIYGIANDPVYRPAVYDISAYASANTEIQIATGGINNMQTLYVDNVRVASSPLGGCAGVFGDEFNVKSYANNDGTLTWAGDWTEIKESDGPTRGDIQVRNEINDYQLRVRDDGYGLWRAADLSGSTQVTLSLDYKRINLDSSSDYVTVDVSSDGGSTWTELDRFEGGGNDTLYQYRYYDITGHAAADTRIRFLGSAGLGGTDEVWFDDIELVCRP